MLTFAWVVGNPQAKDWHKRPGKTKAKAPSHRSKLDPKRSIESTCFIQPKGDSHSTGSAVGRSAVRTALPNTEALLQERLSPAILSPPGRTPELRLGQAPETGWIGWRMEDGGERARAGRSDVGVGGAVRSRLRPLGGKGGWKESRNAKPEHMYSTTIFLVVTLYLGACRLSFAPAKPESSGS